MTKADMVSAFDTPVSSFLYSCFICCPMDSVSDQGCKNQSNNQSINCNIECTTLMMWCITQLECIIQLECITLVLWCITQLEAIIQLECITLVLWCITQLELGGAGAGAGAGGAAVAADMARCV